MSDRKEHEKSRPCSEYANELNVVAADWLKEIRHLAHANFPADLSNDR